MSGFGPFAGMLTFSFAIIGFLRELLAEDIEDMDPTQGEAILATVLVSERVSAKVRHAII